VGARGGGPPGNRVFCAQAKRSAPISWHVREPTRARDSACSREGPRPAPPPNGSPDDRRDAQDSRYGDADAAAGVGAGEERPSSAGMSSPVTRTGSALVKWNRAASGPGTYAVTVPK